MGSLANRVAERFVGAAATSDLLPLLDEVVKLHERTLQPWADKFTSVLSKAQKDSGDLTDGWVWQDEFRGYLGQWDAKHHPKLQALDEKIEKVWLETDYLDDIVNVVRLGTTEPYGKGRIAHAISDISFEHHSGTGRDHIAYQTKTLKEWSDAFKKWSKESAANTKREKRKAQQRIRRQE